MSSSSHRQPLTGKRNSRRLGAGGASHTGTAARRKGEPGQVRHFVYMHARSDAALLHLITKHLYHTQHTHAQLGMNHARSCMLIPERHEQKCDAPCGSVTLIGGSQGKSREVKGSQGKSREVKVKGSKVKSREVKGGKGR